MSTKTIVKIEHGESCTVRTEQKIARGFNTSTGRLWDSTLLSDERQRLVSTENGRWYFSEMDEARQFNRRLAKAHGMIADERPRDDPDEIQDEAERRRLGYAGLSTAFIRLLGGGISAGYYQFNQCELYRRDFTPPDGFNYSYLCYCVRGGIRLGVRGKELVIGEGDAVVFEAGDGYWIEPAEPVAVGKQPPLCNLNCLALLKFKEDKPVPTPS